MDLRLVALGCALLAPAAPAAIQEDERAVLPANPDARLPQDVLRSLARTEPAAEAGVVLGLVSEQLDRVAGALVDGGTAGALEAVVAPGAPIARLRPLHLEEVFGDRLFRVLRPVAAAPPEAPEAGPAEHATGPARLAAELAGLRAALGEGAELFATLEVLKSESAGEGAPLYTLVRVELDAHADAHADARAAQVRARWRCEWDGAADGPENGAPRIARLDLDSYEEVHGRAGETFTDVTRGVLAGERLERQLGPGLTTWRERLDSGLGVGMPGHHGVAVGDVNDDGLEDLYLCQPGGLPNLLLLHRDDGTVVEAGAAAGADLLEPSPSALLVDLDRDTDLDLAVVAGERLLFLSNDGLGSFRTELAVDAPGAMALAAADVDADGWLDVYCCGYRSPYDGTTVPLPYHDANDGPRNVLWYNEGEWRFTDRTEALGLEQGNRRFSLAAAWEDFDHDGDQDLYVANDFGRDNLYRNDAGRFVDVAADLGVGDSPGAGVTWADVDGDGWMDLHVAGGLSPEGGRLLLNRSGAGFVDASGGEAMGRRAWGAVFCELNGDGLPDLYAPNGFVTGERDGDLETFFRREVVALSPTERGGDAAPYRAAWWAIGRLLRRGSSWNGHERDRAFLNLGGWRSGGGGFADVSALTGLDRAEDGRAAAPVDWDFDGDQDLVVTYRTGPRVRVLRNDQASGNGYLAVRVRGRSANADGIGARVEVRVEGGARPLLVATRRAGEGFLAQSSAWMTFGLGSGTVADVRVRWPGGDWESFGSTRRNRMVLLVEGTGNAREWPAPSVPTLADGALSPPAAPAEARVVTAAPLPVPTLVVTPVDGEGSTVMLGVEPGGGGRGTGRHLFLCLVSHTSAPCARQLAALEASAAALRAAGIDVVALSVDPPGERGALVDFAQRAGFTGHVAMASPEALAALDAVQSVLLDRDRRLPLPSSLFVDGGGLLQVLYVGAVEPERAIADTALASLEPARRRLAAVPFPGRFASEDGGADLARWEAAMNLLGLPDVAAELALGRLDARRVDEAEMQVGFGKARLLQEKLEEAARHFERAVELDPYHADAWKGLGYCRHRLGDLAGARDAYREAARLDPGDERNRVNLGLVAHALGDEGEARRQLEWLRARGSGLAGLLEKALGE